MIYVDEEDKVKKLNYARISVNALHGLQGIMQGVVADQRLNQAELFFLEVWLRSQNALEGDPDHSDLLDLIEEILKDGVISQDELDSLYKLSQEAAFYRDIQDSDQQSKLSQLIGILSGISADGIINDSEIEYLSDWLKQNKSTFRDWPASELVTRIQTIIADDYISNEEMQELSAIIQEVTGRNFSDSEFAHGMGIAFLEDNVESLELKGKNICFSGRFVSANKSLLKAIAETEGAIILPDVDHTIDILVLGSMASKDWLASEHGRKIQQVLNLKAKGRSVIIVTEKTWRLLV